MQENVEIDSTDFISLGHCSPLRNKQFSIEKKELFSSLDNVAPPFLLCFRDWPPMGQRCIFHLKSESKVCAGSDALRRA